MITSDVLIRFRATPPTGRHGHSRTSGNNGAGRARALSGPPAVKYRGGRERRSSKPCDAPPPRPAGTDDNERLFSRTAILGAMTMVVRESRSTLKKNKRSHHWTFLRFPESCQLRAPAQRPTARRQEFRSVQERTGLSFHRSLTGDLPGVFIGRRVWSARQAVRARSQGVRNARQSPRSRAGRSTRCS